MDTVFDVDVDAVTVFEPDTVYFLRGGEHLRLLRIQKSHDGKHKYEAHFKSNTGREKVIKFGARGYDDYTTHHDDKRKERYLERHYQRESWSNPETPGALSRWILWNKKSISESEKDFRRRFHLSRK
jgi:hypothetical protein